MFKKLFILALLAAYFTACTKAKPYKLVGKPDAGVKLETKSVIDTSADYLYVPSSVESARTAGASRPHWEGDAKRVRFEFTEKSLKVIEPETDGRFGTNPTNNGAVLSIPIEHVDFRCAEDDYGKCTNKEEENNDIRWDKKSFFRLKPEELALQQVTFLPVELEKYFGSCFAEVGSEFVKAEINKDSVNLILEKTYQAQLKGGCDPGDIESLSDLTFSVRYQHSFVKLKAMASPDYQPIKYTRADESNFGYFSTQKHLLDVDNNDTVNSLNYYFDRWNPKRKTVVYYLSSAFNKPENASLKQASYEAVEAINSALDKAGTPMRLQLRDPVEGMSSGDIRNNMIVLEEDPQAAGVIGYGPHAANPLTGEILHAKVIMYLGTMKKYLKYNYDEIVQDKLAQDANAPVAQATKAPAPPPLTLGPALKQKAAHGSPALAQLGLNGRGLPSGIKIGKLNMKKLRELAISPSRDQVFAKDLHEKIQFMSRHCNYPADLFNFESAVDEGIDEVLKEVELKPWLNMTDTEKEKVIAALLPYVYLPTLIHELGHNLGLRHNFAGSEDKDNFYSEKELSDLGVKRPFKYSSVMDYSYRSTNELHMMGKYDVAALRYAYAEKVELNDGNLISLSDLHKNPALELKSYSYCTDEHVDANPNCSRFDEGTDLLEMAEFWVKAYNDRYKRANFRNGRRNFSLLNDSAQIGAIDGMMNKLRLLFERYESIKNQFDLAADAPEWESIDFLKQLKQATLVAGNFYLDVLKTPDLLCAVSKADKPNQVLAVVPIRQFSKRAISCFDTDNIQLNPQYVIVAEGGKSFASRKDPGSDNPYADQIDVRGIWMDKLLATRYLFGRELGSSLFDQYTENFLDMPEMQQPILETLGGLMTDELQGPVNFRLADGQTVDLNVGYQLFDVNDANNSHKLVPVLDRGARAVFGLPDRTTLFHQLLLSTVVSEEGSDANPAIARALLAQMRVVTEIPRDGREDQYVGVEIGGQRYFTLPDASMAALLMQNLNTVNLLGQFDAEKIQKLMEATSDEGLSDDEVKARALGKDVLEKYLQGGFQQPGFYALMIESLADTVRR